MIILRCLFPLDLISCQAIFLSPKRSLQLSFLFFLVIFSDFLKVLIFFKKIFWPSRLRPFFYDTLSCLNNVLYVGVKEGLIAILVAWQSIKNNWNLFFLIVKTFCESQETYGLKWLGIAANPSEIFRGISGNIEINQFA